MTHACLIIASHFPPMQSAGVFRTVRIAKYLPEYDWSLDVLTLHPSAYVAGSSTSSFSPEQFPENVRIHRTIAKHPNEWIVALKGKMGKQSPRRPAGVSAATCPSSETGTQRPPGLLQRAKDAVTLPLMTPDRWVGWLPFAILAGKRILRHQRPDVLYSSGPPWTNHLIAERLKRASKTAWVADFRDPWVGNHFRPQRLGDTWTGRRHRTLERRVMHAANILIFNTERACAEAMSRFPELPQEKFRVIPNGFDPADFPEPTPGAAAKQDYSQPTEHDRERALRPMRMVHTGTFYGKRNVDSLLDALGQLNREGRVSPSTLQVDLIGAECPGRTREQELVLARGLSAIVNILPPVAHRLCLRKLAEADVLLLVQTDAPLCVPGKLYEYIAVGRPVLTFAADGATADMVHAHHLGQCVAPSETERLKAVLYDLLQQYQTSGLPRPDKSAALHFNGRMQMRDFDNAFRAAMNDHASPPVISERR